jgi:hypothetical protein
MEALERRALVMLVVVSLLFLRAYGLFPTPTWLLAFFMFGLACLTAASVLLVAAIAPAAYLGRWASERERLLFIAFTLLVADIVVTAMIFAENAYAAANHGLG